MTDYKQVLQQEIQNLRDRTNKADLPEDMRSKVEKEIVALERSVELGS